MLEAGDEDANFVNDFEDQILMACQESMELASCFTTYQKARNRLREKARSHGFWPLGNSKGRGRHWNSQVSSNDPRRRIVRCRSATAHRRIRGSLQFAAVHTRPDLAAKVGILQSVVTKRKVKHLIEANRARYEGKRHKVCLMILACSFGSFGRSERAFWKLAFQNARSEWILFSNDIKSIHFLGLNRETFSPTKKKDVELWWAQSGVWSHQKVDLPNSGSFLGEAKKVLASPGLWGKLGFLPGSFFSLKEKGSDPSQILS